MEKAASKGPVLSTAQLAGILATKQTSSLIPLCHPLALSHIQVTFHPEPEKVAVKCEVTVRCEGKTGVEMEALMGVNGALLCVWDMVKAVAGKEMKVDIVCSLLLRLLILVDRLVILWSFVKPEERVATFYAQKNEMHLRFEQGGTQSMHGYMY